MSPAARDILTLAIDGLVAAVLVGLLAYYVLRARAQSAAVKEEQRQAAEMLDIEPEKDPH